MKNLNNITLITATTLPFTTQAHGSSPTEARSSNLVFASAGSPAHAAVSALLKLSDPEAVVEHLRSGIAYDSSRLIRCVEICFMTAHSVLTGFRGQGVLDD